VKVPLPFNYDLERIIDDFILLSFFLGNDFLPNLSVFDITDNSLDQLFVIYKHILNQLGGYLVESGTPVLSRLEIFFRELAKNEREFFKENSLKELGTDTTTAVTEPPQKININLISESKEDTSDWRLKYYIMKFNVMRRNR